MIGIGSSRMTAMRRASPHALKEGLLTIGAVGGLACILLAIGALAFGLTPLIVQSGSMEPTVTTGSLLITQKTPADKLRRGDVVTVPRHDHTLVTHRIVQITLRGDTATLRLKGDANDAIDPEAYEVKAAGKKIVAVPFLGRVAAWASSGIGLFLLGLYVAFLVVTVAIDRRDRASRSMGRGASAAGIGAVMFGAIAIPTVVPQPTYAAWTDDATAGTSALTAYTVTKPVWVSCNVTGSLQKTATIVWQEVSSPYALDYTATIRETGTSMTVTDNGSTRQTQFSAGLLSTVLNQAYHIDVVAKLPSPNGSWVSQTMTQQVTIALLGLGLTCDSHN